MIELRYRRWWQRLGAAMLAAVFGAAFIPSPPVLLSDYISWGDKIEHVAAFAWLMLWHAQIYDGRRQRVVIAVGLVMFGLLIEVLQGALTTTRSADPYDLMADSVGVLVGWGLGRTGLGGALARIEARLFPARAGE